jgi:taurine dioxygenase
MGQSSTGSIEVIPTGAALGADIIGIDLSANIDDAAFQDIYTRGTITLCCASEASGSNDDALVAFSRRFGELDMAPTPAPGERMAAKLPEVAVISNIVVDGKAVGSLGNSELVWHQDMSYNELPPKASLLYGIETPSAGGETFFYNLYDACATLPHALKSRIHGLSCKHDATRNSSGQLRKGFAERYSNAERPGAIHPLIVRHPETGRSSLYLGRRPNAWIVGLSDADSDALLDELWAHVQQGPHLWAQQWRQGIS